MSSIPLTAPLLLVALLVLLFILLSRRNRAVTPKIVYGKRIRWTVIGYMIILLIATGVYYVIPKPVPGSGNVKEVGDSWHIGTQMYDAASVGELGNEYEQYVQGKWEVDIPDASLELEYNQKNGDTISIFVEKGEGDNGVAEIQFYRAPTTVGGFDVSEQIPLIHVDTVPGRMHIANLDSTEIAFTSYEKEFPITQFTGEMNRGDTNIQHSERLLYIQIPEGVELEYSNLLDVTYVNES